MSEESSQYVSSSNFQSSLQASNSQQYVSITAKLKASSSGNSKKSHKFPSSSSSKQGQPHSSILDSTKKGPNHLSPAIQTQSKSNIDGSNREKKIQKAFETSEPTVQLLSKNTSQVIQTHPNILKSNSSLRRKIRRDNSTQKDGIAENISQASKDQTSRVSLKKDIEEKEGKQNLVARNKKNKNIPQLLHRSNMSIANLQISEKKNYAEGKLYELEEVSGQYDRNGGMNLRFRKNLQKIGNFYKKMAENAQNRYPGFIPQKIKQPKKRRNHSDSLDEYVNMHRQQQPKIVKNKVLKQQSNAIHLTIPVQYNPVQYNPIQNNHQNTFRNSPEIAMNNNLGGEGWNKQIELMEKMILMKEQENQNLRRLLLQKILFEND